MQVTVTPIKDSSGYVTNFVGVLQDVTERKASEAAFKLRDHALSNLSEVRLIASISDCTGSLLSALHFISRCRASSVRRGCAS